MIKSSPKTKINVDWRKEELVDYLGILSKSDFNVRAIAWQPSSNVSSFKNWLQHFNQDPDQLFTWYEFRKIYLFYDAVHLMKNIRNNLLNNKRFFIFPSFKSDDLKEPIRVRERCFFRRQLEKSSKASNKGTTPRMQTKCFGSTRNTSWNKTAATLQSYFPNEKSIVWVPEIIP